MIAAVAVHFAIHWSWVKSTARRMARSLAGKGSTMNRHGYFNIAIDATVALSFLLAAVSGVYFMSVPGNGWVPDPRFIFTRATWDLIHTWSGVTLIAAAIIHFAIHWNWVFKVTGKVFCPLSPRRAPAGKPPLKRPVAGSARV